MFHVKQLTFKVGKGEFARFNATFGGCKSAWKKQSKAKKIVLIFKILQL